MTPSTSDLNSNPPPLPSPRCRASKRKFFFSKYLMTGFLPWDYTSPGNRPPACCLGLSSSNPSLNLTQVHLSYFWALVIRGSSSLSSQSQFIFSTVLRIFDTWLEMQSLNLSWGIHERKHVHIHQKMKTIPTLSFHKPLLHGIYFDMFQDNQSYFNFNHTNIFSLNRLSCHMHVI